MLRSAMASPEALQREDCTIAWELLPAKARDGATIVLLHGFGMNRDAMRPLALQLLEREAGGQAVLVDARGHGETKAPPQDAAYGYPAMRDDLIALIGHAAPEAAHLVGHSMGGQIALMAAILRPDLVRSLSLIGAGPCRAVTLEKERKSWQRAAASFERATPEELESSLAAAAPTVARASGCQDAKLAPAALYHTARGAELARVVRGGFLGVESNDDACASLRTPTLLIA